MRRLCVTSILILCAALTLCEVAFAVPATWQQLAELTPSNRAKNDWFGISIASSGNTVVVGDFDANIETYGTVDVFVKPASGWANMTQTATLTSSDNGIGFGVSVAISGDIIVVGAANTSNFHDPADTAGAAYVFVKPAGGWKNMTETLKLTATDGMSGDAFGDSVSVSGNTIAVGAFFVNNFSGRVYVFTCSSGTCTQAAELTASDSDGILDYLGCSVAISGNTVIAGSYGHNNFEGSAYVYVEPAGGWTNMTETAELSTGGEGSDNMGFSVAISGGTAVAGAPGAFNYYGAAYVFVEPPTGWVTTSSYTAGLGAPDAAQYDSFGQAVAINENGKAIAVGAPGQNIGANLEQGAVYAYGQPKSGWKTTRHAYAEATASDGASADLMGTSIAVSGATVVAGAPKSSSPGAAYVFGR